MTTHQNIPFRKNDEVYFTDGISIFKGSIQKISVIKKSILGSRLFLLKLKYPHLYNKLNSMNLHGICKDGNVIVNIAMSEKDIYISHNLDMLQTVYPERDYLDSKVSEKKSRLKTLQMQHKAELEKLKSDVFEIRYNILRTTERIRAFKLDHKKHIKELALANSKIAALKDKYEKENHI